MRTRIKICGLTSKEALHMVVDAGADAVGFNMYQPSARFISVSRATELVHEAPPFVCTVGLFVNHDAQEIAEIIADCPFDLLQFHGDETDEFCGAFNIPFIKVLRVGEGDDIAARLTEFPNSRGILLDTKVAGQFGGTGVSIDWSKLPALNQSITLAGGLTPENVPRAMAIVNPYAVDVSGGVESSPGIKDEQRVRAFVSAVREADAAREASAHLRSPSGR